MTQRCARAMRVNRGDIRAPISISKIATNHVPVTEWFIHAMQILRLPSIFDVPFAKTPVLFPMVQGQVVQRALGGRARKAWAQVEVSPHRLNRFYQ